MPFQVGLSRSDIFYFSIYFFVSEFRSIPKNSGPNPGAISVLIYWMVVRAMMNICEYITMTSNMAVLIF